MSDLLTWDEVKKRVAQKIPKGKRLYGVPRGGCIAVALSGNPIAMSPESADVIVDDIIDSGATRERYVEQHKKPFIGLWDKTAEDSACGWITFPWESGEEHGPEDAVRRLLQWVGEDPNRDGLKETPKRVTKAFRELCAGYSEDPKNILSKTFDEPCDEMIVVRDIAFNSTCEHHLLPFNGIVHVGYIPGKVVGLSKIARLVDCYSRRLQIQERLTSQIADSILSCLDAQGVAVVINAHHACMGCRGVKKPTAKMLISAMRGLLKTDHVARSEFLQLIG